MDPAELARDGTRSATEHALEGRSNPRPPIVAGMEVAEAFTTRSAAETEMAGARLAARLRAGDVIAVVGELGAGKTTFVRGACRALGVRLPVTSPTFTIGHRYEAPVPVAHLDLYRLAGLGAEEWGDLEPYFDGTIVFVEWPEHAGTWLPRLRATVRLAHLDEFSRSIRVDSDNDPRL
jgi:tRNA threonylcarbamoyladenosine biosynthesis protein TsaE